MNDPVLYGMIGDYMQKTGSVSTEMQDLASRAETYLDRTAATKTAAVSAIKDRAEKLAYLLSTTRLPDGHSIVEGHEQLKVAALMLQDHDRSLSVLELALNAIKSANAKVAAVEPGHAVGVASNTTKTDIEGDFYKDVKRLR